MKCLNKMCLIGCVGNDPKSANAGNDTVVNFSVATSETYKDRNGEFKTITEWHDVVIWNQYIVNDVLKKVRKGSYVFIEGQLKTSIREDKETKQSYKKVQVVLGKFGGTLIVLERKQNGDQGDLMAGNVECKNQPTPPTPQKNNNSYDDDEIPF